MTAHRGSVRRTLFAAAVPVAALALAACGGGTGGAHATQSVTPRPTATATASAGTHNAADVSFATEMIQHHRQAVEMAGLAHGRARSATVEALARKIRAAQAPEITTMSGWLTSWGEPLPEDMTGMGHDMSPAMPGMMAATDMNRLRKASGAAFDTLFLTLMVQHHQGAVTMAKSEQGKGSYGPAIALAGNVVVAQSAEIERMRQLLGQV
ncbi:DUF305 domain-containing protein [Streptomyces sp. NPDC005423]|uniref:DUF305 domain-containing protein n=1 Tax=Streptomyces sp. NPDC005423 TaxID=3155343 RepID=UPI0033AC2BEE